MRKDYILVHEDRILVPEYFILVREDYILVHEDYSLVHKDCTLVRKYFQIVVAKFDVPMFDEARTIIISRVRCSIKSEALDLFWRFDVRRFHAEVIYFDIVRSSIPKFTEL